MYKHFVILQYSFYGNYNIKSKLGTYHEEIKIGKRTDISPNEAYMHPQPMHPLLCSI
jgi:hypothetical protein